MVVDESDRMGRILGDQRLIEKIAQIVILALLGSKVEILMQRHVEQIEGEIGRFQIFLDGAVFIFPIFADDIEVVAVLGTDRFDEIPHELVVDVLDGIQAEAVDASLLDVPVRPLFDFFDDSRVAVIDVRIHQVIVIAVFAVDALVFRPTFVEAFDHVDGFFAGFVIEVRAGEMFPGPFEVGIFVTAAGESEFRPAFDFVGA